MSTDVTIDPREREYYTRLAEQWWDSDGVFWPLHRLNRMRSEYLKQQICRHYQRDPSASLPLGGLRIVDVGCGGGILSESMAALGAQVLGIDVVEKNIRIAREHNRQQKLPIEYENIGVEDLVRRGEVFDVVLNMEVVEHVADLETFVAACNRLVGPDGMAFIATINRTWLSWLFAIVGAEYILRWLPRGTHRWDRFVKPGELDGLLARDGLQVIDRRGVQVNPVTRGFSLSGRLAVNYMLAATPRS